MLRIEIVKNVLSERNGENGNSTIFYTYGSGDFKVVPYLDFPIKKGDEVTYSGIRKHSRAGNRYILIFSIHLTKNNYRKLPKIGKDNTRVMEFGCYGNTKKGIKVIVGFAERIFTPQNSRFEKLVTLPLKKLGCKNIPKYKYEGIDINELPEYRKKEYKSIEKELRKQALFNYLADLTDAAAPYVGRKLKVKLRWQKQRIILGDGNYLLKVINF